MRYWRLELPCPVNKKTLWLFSSLEKLQTFLETVPGFLRLGPVVQCSPCNTDVLLTSAQFESGGIYDVHGIILDRTFPI